MIRIFMACCFLFITLSARATDRLADCKALLALEDQARANNDGIEASCKKLQAANEDLQKQNDELKKLTDARFQEQTASLQLALSSKAELEKTVHDLKTELDACIESSSTPWYARWELWVGAVAGVAAGFTVGFVAGEL